MLPYTICFLKYKNQILLLNRMKAPWMGNWNGVGGKLEPNETPEACVLREVEEETGIVLEAVSARGEMHWTNFGEANSGMYVYTAELTERPFQTPIATAEGILDFKPLDWILAEANTGVVNNLKPLFESVFTAEPDSRYLAAYEGNKLVQFCKKIKR